MQKIAEGMTRSEIFDSFVFAGNETGIPFDQSGIRMYANGGSHDGGLRIVGEQGPELEYTRPSYITSNTATKDLLDNSDVEAAIERMAMRVVVAINENTDIVGASATHISAEVRNSSDKASSEAWRQSSRDEL